MSVKEFTTQARNHLHQQQKGTHTTEEQRVRVLQHLAPTVPSTQVESGPVSVSHDEQTTKKNNQITQLAQKMGLQLSPSDLQVVQDLWSQVSLLRTAQGETRSDQEIVGIFLQRLQQLASHNSPSAPPRASAAVNPPIANQALGRMSDDHMLDMTNDSTMSDSQDPDVAAKEILQKRNRYSFDSALSGKDLKRPKRNS